MKGDKIMANTIISEEQVKQALRINNFREISKDKIMEFVSLIPNMDKDVAISIINQFPAYAESAKVMVEQMNALCEGILRDNSDSRSEVISAYQKVLDSLATLLNREELDEQERRYVTEKMIMVADRIAAKDTENKEFLGGVLKYGVLILGGALILGAAILGVSVKGTKIPMLSKA
jgi:hypothetical protein